MNASFAVIQQPNHAPVLNGSPKQRRGMGRSAICAPAKMEAEGYSGDLGIGCFDGLHFSCIR